MEKVIKKEILDEKNGEFDKDLDSFFWKINLPNNLEVMVSRERLKNRYTAVAFYKQKRQEILPLTTGSLKLPKMFNAIIDAAAISERALNYGTYNFHDSSLWDGCEDFYINEEKWK